MKEILYVGCAGWSVPPNNATTETNDNVGCNKPFGCSTTVIHLETQKEKRKSHLERYTAFFSAVEINSSFYRSHLPETYGRWRQTVSRDFRFSVKFPRVITHELRLKNCNGEVEKFLQEVENLEKTLGCLLIQLPPSLGFNAKIADDFFALIQDKSSVSLALEPRHPSWFASNVFRQLEKRDIALVHADPHPAGSTMIKLPQTASMAYFRLHGSPTMYHSSYNHHYLNSLLQDIVGHHSHNTLSWCIFDNTASGAAFPNALALNTMWHKMGKSRRRT